MFHGILYLLCFILTILKVKCEAELLILHSPETLQFHGHDSLPLSQLKNVLSTSLGYSVEEENDWPAMEFKSISFVEAILMFVIPGVNSLSSSRGKSFPLIIDEDIDNTFDIISERTELRYPDKNNILQKIVMEEEIRVIGKPELLINNAEKSNSTSENEDGFIEELSKLQDVVQQMLKKKHKDGLPDIYWITLPNLAHASQLHGENSKELLLTTIIALTEKSNKIYNGKVFVGVITGGEETSNKRMKRQTPPLAPTMESLNVADDYDENFPIIFNIILWFSIALLFSLIAISMVIAGMDPGRDSIIYRMTSTRMKKDN